MDFILDYPQEKVIYIGLFMAEKNISGKGIGTVIGDFFAYFRQSAYCKVRLAVDEGNPQSSAFWRKNGFAETGERFPAGESAYLVMECWL